MGTMICPFGSRIGPNVGVGVIVTVGVAVGVRVFVGVADSVAVAVGVRISVGKAVGVMVSSGVGVTVGVGVSAGRVGLTVGVLVRVGAGWMAGGKTPNSDESSPRLMKTAATAMPKTNPLPPLRSPASRLYRLGGILCSSGMA